MEKLFLILDEIKASAEPAAAVAGNRWLSNQQTQACMRYDLLPVPNPREKSWSKLASLQIPKKPFRLAAIPQVKHLHSAGQDKSRSGRVDIREDALDFRLDEQAAKIGVILCDLENAAEKHPQLLEQIYGKFAQSQPGKIAEFTAGMGRYGFLLYVPGNTKIEKPVEITTHLSSDGTVLPATAVVILEESASIPLVMRQTSEGADNQNTISTMNLMVEIGDGAVLRFLEVQKFGKAAWNFTSELFLIGQDASLEHLLLDTGSAVIQRKLTVVLEGAGGQANITGIYTPHAGQVFTYDTHQNHLASNTTSDLLFGGVLSDDAYTLWKGNVYVAEGTKGTDGFQRNQNLLLAEGAHAESIPGLEIIADDVRCSHAVTLSSLDPEQLFFLQSRGIGKEEAGQLIVSGFLESAATRIKDEQLKENIQNELF